MIEDMCSTESEILCDYLIRLLKSMNLFTKGVTE